MDFVEYKNYGRCAKLERGGAVALVTLDIGPRIIYYGRSFNFMNEDLDRNVQKGGEFFDVTYRKGEKWYLYGGHRVWKSPEDMPTYTPDNYPVEATYDNDGFGGTFVCRASKFFTYAMTVKIDKTGGLDVENTVSDGDGSRISVWALSVLAKGGTLTVPLNDKVDDLNPSQNVVLWPYNDLNDERVSLSHERLQVRQTEKPEALKLGLMSKKGRAYYTLKGETLRVSVQAPSPDKKVYGDFGCNFETYTNQHILEMEWLSDCKTVGKGDSLSLKQRFEILTGTVKFD